MIARTITRWPGGVIRVVNRQRRTEAMAWRDAVVANGGSVGADRLAIVAQFIAAEKADGTWALTDDYWGFWAENAIQALTSMKQRRLATAVNSPTFTEDRGYTGNGSTSYVDTGFNPASHAVAMTADSIRLAPYERTFVGGSGATAGAQAISNRALFVRTAGLSMAANGQAATFTQATNIGMISDARRGSLATDQVGFRNGVAMTRTVNASALGATLPDQALFVNCLNNSGTAALFRATQVGFLAAGAALSDAQELAQYNNVQAWATAVGAQV